MVRGASSGEGWGGGWGEGEGEGEGEGWGWGWWAVPREGGQAEAEERGWFRLEEDYE